MCETQSDTAEFEFEDANWDEWRPRSNCEIASDDDHDAETTETSQTTLRDALAEWAITYSVSLAALSASSGYPSVFPQTTQLRSTQRCKNIA